MAAQIWYRVYNYMITLVFAVKTSQFKQLTEGRLNLLVSTSALEERLNVPACNLACCAVQACYK